MKETIVLSRESYDKLSYDSEILKKYLEGEIITAHRYGFFNTEYYIISENKIIKDISLEVQACHKRILTLEKKNETLKKNIFLRIKKAFYSRFK